jgi:WD40 repeat protein
LRKIPAHGRRVSAIAIAPDAPILATGGEDGNVRLWNMRTWQMEPVGDLRPEGGPIRALAFSSDGKTLAIGDYDGKIRFWNVATRRETGALPAHHSFVRSLAFSPDETLLASSGNDNTLRLWRAPLFNQTDRH